MKFSLTTAAILALLATDLKAQSPAAIDPPTQIPPAQNAPTQNFSKHIAIIEGDKSRGSGFIAIYQEKPFLFTNSHVLSGNTKVSARLLSGQTLNLQGLSIADKYDVSIFQQDTAQEGLEIIKDLESNVAIGDEVIVLGNSLGAGVTTEIRGKITGIGPELVEVDAAFVSGNSGSPVIHAKTGQVIGIATFSVKRTLEGFGADSKFNSVERRFAYRIDNVPSWYNTNWLAFSRESAKIASLQQRNTDIWNLALDLAENGEITRWSDHLRRDNQLAITTANWQKELGRAQTMSRIQLQSEKKRFLNGVMTALQSDLSFVKPTQFNSYNRREYDRIIEERGILKTYFRALHDAIASDPRYMR